MSRTAKEKIIESARRLFSEKGFAATSTQSIAETAKVSHSLIFHHFVNKAALWNAVKQNIAQDRGAHSKVLPDTTLEFNDFLENLVWQNMAFYCDHPDIVKMIGWQRLEMGAVEVGAESSTEVNAWLKAIRHYQTLKKINPHLEPSFIMGLILSLTSSAALDSKIWLKKAEELDAYILFCIDALKKALCT